MLSVEQAQAEILSRVRALPIERVDVLAALGRVLAEPIRSTRRIPPWPNSSMDGYALRAADSRPAATLRVVGRIAAGTLPDRAIGAGENGHESPLIKSRWRYACTPRRTAPPILTPGRYSRPISRV